MHGTFAKLPSGSEKTKLFFFFFSFPPVKAEEKWSHLVATVPYWVMGVLSDSDVGQVHAEVMSDVRGKLGRGGATLLGQMSRFTVKNKQKRRKKGGKKQ